MNILHVSSHDAGGGAARIAVSLMEASRKQGHTAWLATGFKGSADSEVIQIPRRDETTPWSRLWTRAAAGLDGHGHRRGVASLQGLLKHWGRSPRQRHRARGHEDFDYPDSWDLLRLVPWKPDIVHLHNLHGGFFDLRALPALSRTVPVVMTLHDAWLLSGHCAHSFACERWQTGCGHCPDLRIPPAIRRDATRYNWRLKRALYRRSRVFVATPSHWLMRRVEASILQRAIVESRVIHNGVDLAIFKPAMDRQRVRAQLGLPRNAFVLLMTAFRIRDNKWKDHTMLIGALQALGMHDPRQQWICVALGECQAAEEKIGHIQIRYVPYCQDQATVSSYYQAADVYLHPAKVDTFPNAVIEAMACGIPVIATAVGGIPEQVQPLERGESTATGILVAPGQASAMGQAIALLADRDDLRRQLGANALLLARQRFCLDRMTDQYLSWYEQIRSATTP